jgi:hypothetical protein
MRKLDRTGPCAETRKVLDKDRSHPIRGRRPSDDLLDRVSQQKFGVPYYGLSPSEGGLWPFERDLVEESLGAGIELGLRDDTATERGGLAAQYRRKVTAKKQEIIARLKDIAQDATFTTGSSQAGRELRFQLIGEYFEAQAELATFREGVAAIAFGEDSKEHEPNSDDPLERSLGEYHVLLAAATSDTGRFNSEVFNRRLEILGQSWTPGQRLFVRANTHTLPVPLALLRILPENTRERIRLSEIARANQLQVRADQRRRQGR